MILGVGTVSRVWGEGVTRAELQKERNGDNSVHATTDGSIRLQYRTASCTSKHTYAQQLQTGHVLGQRIVA